MADLSGDSERFPPFPSGTEDPNQTGPLATSGDHGLAGWWQRVGAVVLDGLIIFVGLGITSAVIALVGGFKSGHHSAAVGLGTALLYGLYGLLTVVYPGLTMRRTGRHNGQTWGKQAMGIRVQRGDSQPVTFWYAILREFVVKHLLFGTIGWIFAGIPALLDYLWPLWDKDNEALHDKVVTSQVHRVGLT